LIRRALSSYISTATRAALSLRARAQRFEAAEMRACEQHGPAPRASKLVTGSAPTARNIELVGRLLQEVDAIEDRRGESSGCGGRRRRASSAAAARASDSAAISRRALPFMTRKYKRDRVQHEARNGRPASTAIQRIHAQDPEVAALALVASSRVAIPGVLTGLPSALRAPV